jgi:hypothetical protein
MATILDEIKDFVNKAKSRIATLTDETLEKECIDSEIILFKELRAAIEILEPNCCDECDECDYSGLLTDNEKWSIMSYLIDKGDLDNVPLCPFVGCCIPDVIIDGNLVNGVPPHNNLVGLQGGDSAGNYFHLSLSEYNKVVALPPVTPAIEVYKFTTDGTALYFDVDHTLNTMDVMERVINTSDGHETEFPKVNRISNTKIRFAFPVALVAGIEYTVMLIGIYGARLSATPILDIDGTNELDIDGTIELE